jgi:hypothetical protein
MLTADLSNVVAWLCVTLAVWLTLLMFARRPPRYYALESPVERVDRIARLLFYAGVIWALKHAPG